MSCHFPERIADLLAFIAEIRRFPIRTPPWVAVIKEFLSGYVCRFPNTSSSNIRFRSTIQINIPEPVVYHTLGRISSTSVSPPPIFTAFFTVPFLHYILVYMHAVRSSLEDHFRAYLIHFIYIAIKRTSEI